MDENTQRKKRVIISIFYYAIILGLFYCFLKYAFGIFLPFIAAIIIAIVLQRPINFLTEKTHIKKGVVSTILVLLLVAVISTGIVFLSTTLISAVKSFASFLTSKIDSLPSFMNTIQEWFFEKIKFLPDSAEKVIHNAIDTLSAKLTSVAASNSVNSATSGSAISGFNLSSLSAPITGIWSVAKGIPSMLISIVVSIIAACFVTADYDSLKGFIVRQFKGEKRIALSKTKIILKDSILKLCKAYAIIIFITFCEMTLGLKILSWFNIYTGGFVVFIAMITAVVDIMPVLGTGTIIVPWALYSFITGNVPLGIGLLVIYAFISVARQFIEPKLVAGQLGLPPFVTIMGMYLGLKLFGVIGMMIVPLAIILLKLLNDDGVIHIWEPSKKEDKVEEVKENFVQRIIKKAKEK